MLPTQVAADETLRQCRPDEAEGAAFSRRESGQVPKFPESSLRFPERPRPQDHPDEFDEIFRAIVWRSAHVYLAPRGQKDVHRTALMRKVRIPLRQEFLERQDSIGNEGLRTVSKPFQVNEEPPIPKLAFAAFFEQEVDRLPEPPIPGDETHVEFPSDADVLAVEEQDPIAFAESLFRPFKERTPAMERALDATMRRPKPDIPPDGKTTVRRAVEDISFDRRTVPTIPSPHPKRLPASIASPSRQAELHSLPSRAVRTNGAIHPQLQAVFPSSMQIRGYRQR